MATATISRIQVVNPTSSNATIKVSGDWFIVEEMSAGDDTVNNRTAIHPQRVSGSGVPTIKRAKVVLSEAFNELVIEANSGATADNTVTILIGTGCEIDVNLPDA